MMLHDSDPVLLRGSRVDGRRGVMARWVGGVTNGAMKGRDMGGSLVSSKTRGKSLGSAARVTFTLAAQ